MRVIELVIDGFKSYAVRTVISNWDDRFNAITGLNGSGKSNILDAICFVLGITNMSTVRASSVQELIYKRGQAGVTKASVTIVFDNSDKSTSPIGFDECGQISVTRQIVLGGTTKYLINGHRAQQQTVQNLFQSVGLNVNNPNFLIMQGRITKVLNMKPAEVLAMIEEAAGTRMFEDRRDRAIRTMGKKEGKLREIQALLRDEIEPKLEKLRAEKRAFLDFQQAQTDIDRLGRVVAAYDWWTNSRRETELEAEAEAHRRTVKEMREKDDRLTAELAVLDADIERVKVKIAAEAGRAGTGLEDDARKAANEAVRLATAIEIKRQEVSDGVAAVDVGKVRAAEAVERLEECQTQVATARADWTRADEQRRRLETDVATRENVLQTAVTGVAEKAGDGVGFEGRVAAAKSRVGELGTAVAAAQRRAAMLADRAKSEHPELVRAEAEQGRLEASRVRLAAELADLDARVGDDGDEAAVREEQAQLQTERRKVSGTVDALKAAVPAIDFAYSDPEPGFDRRRVFGVVARLFSVQDVAKMGMAIEVAAGGRLWNVVVDSSDTGAALLEKGRLGRRVTLIPLDKISGPAAAERIRAAKRIAPGRVEGASELVEYDGTVERAIGFVFGGVLVADNAATAQQVTFDSAVRLRTVTVDGDVYDPAGTLSGGSRARGGNLLDSVAEIVAAESRLADIDGRLAALADTMAKIAKKGGLRQAAAEKRCELDVLDEQLRTGTAAATIGRQKQLGEDARQVGEDVVRLGDELTHAREELERAETDLASFGRDRGGTLAELKKVVGALRAELAEADRETAGRADQLRQAEVDVDLAEEEAKNATEAVAAEDNAVTKLRAEIDVLSQEERTAKEQAAAADAKVAAERAAMAGHADDLADLDVTRRQKAKAKTDAGLAAKQADIGATRAAADGSSAKNRRAALEVEHDWILVDKDGFGQPGGRYDFGDPRAMTAAKAQLAGRLDAVSAMRRRINPKVINMIGAVEKKESGLRTMMRTVVKDKRKIEDTISTLDRYKREALAKTWRAVNRDFGAVFADVLPGSFAKLDPVVARGKGAAAVEDADDGPDGVDENGDADGTDEAIDLSAGLAIKVRLGALWKSSLAELSGGQRSLVALALILALLQAKPAPMYILDEVDAALDLSHTQNIGALIRARFGRAQFIVVSLKDGMWANANRVFRTTFVGGTSVVRVEK